MPNPPPGISDSDFRTALRRFEEIVGKEWVFSSDEDVLLYRDGYSPLWGEAEERIASAAVAPASVEQIQGIVQIASRIAACRSIRSRRAAILTYGGSAPAYSGSVVWI